MNDDAFWIWGRHPVLEALRAQRVRSLTIAAGRRPAAVLDEIVELARAQRLQIRETDLRELDALAPGANTQGVAALATIERLDSLEAILTRNSRKSTQPFILVLDQVQDPHNFGALLRSAEASAVEAVVVPERRSAPLGGTVAKTSAGALSLLPILEVSNLARALDDLKSLGIWLMGLEARGDIDYYRADLTVPLALVIGGEEHGLRRLTRERCDLLLRLPMFGAIESLNASVAGSIAMFECVRQRAVAP